jgi:hypothetical protein
MDSPPVFNSLRLQPTVFSEALFVVWRIYMATNRHFTSLPMGWSYPKIVNA